MLLLQKLNVAPESIPRTKFRLHVVIGVPVLITFILTIARIADSGTPRARTNTWGIAVCLKSAVFMAYQLLTTHVTRLKRWANTKMYITLNVIDTVFWFALVVISIMGAMGSTSVSSRALGAVLVILAIGLVPLSGALAWVCILERREMERGGLGQTGKGAYSGV
ncbi:hypothetical protein BDW74DRAFT_164428 [Aspergillus multicolor]|uniref:uncharacterized protein n=1 Tax=Aspergillus multicolor TaxID=41759 RepID=UPI003CCC90A2